MATICSNCGEELIGAVNRCWRCGREFEIDSLSDVPPVRRMRILPEYLHARPTTSEAAKPADTLADVAIAATAQEDVVTAELVEKPAAAPLRLDSPFQIDSVPTTERIIPWTAIALSVGGLGALLSLVSIVGVPLVLVSIGIIIWRAGSIPARHAWLLLLIAILMLLIGSFRVSIAMHDHFFGRPLFPSLIP
ncbi:hypothetical protein LOC68_11200 [Blastopirellula sp. JC732]|uniref:Uncharacterized protein n=1 Tax=Blastopirellula sediminis TaxID=2894196 RepID=A0A9X1MMJ4_9BACT|nr:hypothetical protein [Blastopirellula sediminis]MCC9609721.1 hypothetical protein [Blastopirellula sediminis]MCC9628965.1 hypothetical protein [Blastopirellula sediminis]